MDPFFYIFNLIIHFDKYLPGIIETYGLWTYLILFVIIFCETGLVVMPYLPGDSLLFVAGAMAGSGYLNLEILLISFFFAAVIGDSVNYWIGNTAGMKVLEKNYSLIRRDHLEKTQEYFTRYGGITIVIARFIPFIRTFAPFLAGVGKMNYRWFLTYNVIGATLWILGFTLAGYFFGGIPIVRENFNYIIYAIIALSLFAVISIVIGVFRTVRASPVESKNEEKKE
ncbi:MAG: VTT domain-containing protein [Methanoregula sp.]|nr:VTT domain-containing protein [Methanoregula sp.]